MPAKHDRQSGGEGAPDRDAAYLAARPSDLLNVIEGSLQGILIHQDEHVRYANPALARMFDYASPDEIIGRPLWEVFVVPDNVPMLQERTRLILAGETVPPHPGWRAITKTGREVWVATAASLIEWCGRPAVVSFYLDITATRRAEEERLRLEAQIQHAQKLESLAVLAGGVAHDFNNLLTAMLGYAGLAKLHLPPDGSALSMLEGIEQAALRAADLTRQMLAYAGKGAFVIEPIDLAAVVREMAGLLTTVISKDAVLRLEPAPAPMHGDATQVRQIVMNLITNASEALTGAGSILVRTGTRHVDSDSLRSLFVQEDLPGGLYAFVEVADSGYGMTPEVAARVFDPFFTTKFTGRGLGLAAVLGIVRGHQGTIQVTSRPGAGSTFHLLFPSRSGPIPAPAAAPNTTPWRGRGIVLVVDDETVIRELACQMLEEIGFSVLAAGDGREALSVFTARAAELSAVLLDVTMPGLDGIDCLRELRRIRASVPVILTSGYSEKNVSQRLHDVRPDAFLAKPYSLDELQLALRKVVEK